MTGVVIGDGGRERVNDTQLVLPITPTLPHKSDTEDPDKQTE